MNERGNELLDRLAEKVIRKLKEREHCIRSSSAPGTDTSAKVTYRRNCSFSLRFQRVHPDRKESQQRADTMAGTEVGRSYLEP